jgi:DNA-binding NtrC family response regulator
MRALSVVLYQQDSREARTLAQSLAEYFHSVGIAPSLSELRTTVAKRRADIVVLDMELACLEEVERLHQDFPSLCIVGTHRLADEEIWTAALSAGASDVCAASDVRGILLSAIRNAQVASRAVA